LLTWKQVAFAEGSDDGFSFAIVSKKENGREKLPSRLLRKCRHNTIRECLDSTQPKAQKATSSQRLQPFKLED